MRRVEERRVPACPSGKSTRAGGVRNSPRSTRRTTDGHARRARMIPSARPAAPGSGKRRYQSVPFLRQRAGGGFTARASVPIPRVGQIALDPVQIGVDQRPIAGLVVLRARMGALPVAFRFPPQALERRAEAGWRPMRGMTMGPCQTASFLISKRRNFRTALSGVVNTGLPLAAATTPWARARLNWPSATTSTSRNPAAARAAA